MLDIQCSSTEKTTDSYMLNHWLACQRILCEVVFPQQKHATVLLENIVIRNQNMHWGFPYQITSLPGCYNIFKAKVCGPSKNEIKATPFGTKHFQFTQKDFSKTKSLYSIYNYQPCNQKAHSMPSGRLKFCLQTQSCICDNI